MKKILFLTVIHFAYFSFAAKADCQNLKNNLADLKKKQIFLNQDLDKNVQQLEANQKFLDTYNKDCRMQQASNKKVNCNSAMYSMIAAQMPSLSVQQDQLKMEISENKIVQDQSAEQYKLCAKK